MVDTQKVTMNNLRAKETIFKCFRDSFAQR